MTGNSSNASSKDFEQLGRMKAHPMRQPLSLWFAELELLFASVGIVDDSVKLFYVLTKLEDTISDAKLGLLEFSLIFAYKPEHGQSPYETLKEQMLSVYQDMSLED